MVKRLFPLVIVFLLAVLLATVTHAQSNLITNGTFDSNINSWTVVSGNWSYSGGAGNPVGSARNATTAGTLRQEFTPTDVGNYSVSGEFNATCNGTKSVVIRRVSDSVVMLDLNSTNQSGTWQSLSGSVALSNVAYYFEFTGTCTQAFYDNASVTLSATATPTDTPVPPTDTPTNTPEPPTPTDTPVPPTDTPTNTPEPPTPTDTPVPPTDTPTNTPEPPTPTDTPLPPTDTPTNTPEPPTPTDTPVPPTNTPTNTPGVPTPTNTPGSPESLSPCLFIFNCTFDADLSAWMPAGTWLWNGIEGNPPGAAESTGAAAGGMNQGFTLPESGFYQLSADIYTPCGSYGQAILESEEATFLDLKSLSVDYWSTVTGVVYLEAGDYNVGLAGLCNAVYFDNIFINPVSPEPATYYVALPSGGLGVFEMRFTAGEMAIVLANVFLCAIHVYNTLQRMAQAVKAK